MGKRLFNFYGKPELIISSGAVRALTTAKFFANTCEYPIENIQINDHLYLASSRKIVEIIQSIEKLKDQIIKDIKTIKNDRLF